MAVARFEGTPSTPILASTAVSAAAPAEIAAYVIQVIGLQRPTGRSASTADLKVGTTKVRWLIRCADLQVSFGVRPT
jgi:hypothetical protein